MNRRERRVSSFFTTAGSIKFNPACFAQTSHADRADTMGSVGTAVKAAHDMLEADDAKMPSCNIAPSESSLDSAELPGACLDDLEPIEPGSFCHWNTDDSGSTRGGFGSPEPGAASAGESSQLHDAHDHTLVTDLLREHNQTQAATISRHEARLLTNRLTGWDLHFENQNAIPTGGATRLRRDDRLLGMTRRPPVIRASSSYNRNVEQGQVDYTWRHTDVLPVSLRSVHNRSVGQDIVDELAR